MWDYRQSALKDVERGQNEKCNPMPVIWLKPTTEKELNKSRAESKYSWYNCPIYFSPGKMKSKGIICLLEVPGVHNSPSMELPMGPQIISSIQLPSLQRPSLWTEKRVSLTCSIKKVN